MVFSLSRRLEVSSLPTLFIVRILIHLCLTFLVALIPLKWEGMETITHERFRRDDFRFYGRAGAA